jgi:glycosyltransferase involved in cell wall biosynthesis
MKILIFNWRGPGHPLSGGAEISTFEHAKAWVDAGHSVTLLTSYFKGGKKEEYINGVHVVRKGSDVFGVHIMAFIWYVFGKHEKFNLVIDQFHGIPFFIPLYVWTKKLAFIHEVAKEVWWLNPWPKPFNLIPGIVGTIFEPLVFKLFYKHIPFMTVSESTKKDLVNWGIPSNNVRVIYNGVNYVSTRIKKEKRKTVMFLGALAKDKGIEDAIRTFAIIGKKDKEFQFWVVGYGGPDFLKELKNQSRGLGINKRIKFWGFVDNKKKFELLSRAHILLNPSIREGWGFVNIEANSVGTPVVGYDAPGIRDSVVNNKTGLLSKLNDCEELAKNVVKLCNSANSYDPISVNAISWAKQFTWKKSTKESLKLIENL